MVTQIHTCGKEVLHMLYQCQYPGFEYFSCVVIVLAALISEKVSLMFLILLVGILEKDRNSFGK